MEAVNGGSLGEDKGGPPPPSPLTGCYLLVVVGEPHSGEHKDIILQRVAKGLLSWDVNNCLVDLEKELSIITDQGLEGEEARYGERLIQFASENLVTEILIHPAVSTLSQCVRNLLSSFTRHRHIIHAGYTFQGNGSWALQDGTFSYSDFSEAFQEIEVQRVIHAYENGISIDLHCSPEGDWTRLPKEHFTKACKVRFNPTDVLTTGSPSISNFIKYLAPFLVPTSLENILESSDVVGNIRFSRPTLYVFPGGQGDAALFGINGFNMLLDGGYSRKACFWDFVRHLDRLDAVLMTRLNNSSICGISSVLKRKKQGAVYPQVGHFFCNIQERKSLLSPDGDKDRDPLIFSILEEGQSIVQDLQHLNLTPQSCYRDTEPIILYHKVGHGTLNMYVLSPDKNSREVREFLQKWNQSDPKMFTGTRGGRDFSFPLQNLVSICSLLVWQPANPNDTITRILYPGSTPQKKIFDGLDRLKSLEYIKHPVCSEKSLAPVKKSKQEVLEKLASKDKVIGEKRAENKLIEEAMKNGEMNGDVVREKQVKKSESLESDKEKKTKKIEDVKKIEESKRSEKIEDVEKSVENGEKVKSKGKSADIKSAKRRGDSQQRKKLAAEKKGPPTPKKTVENKTNGEAKEKKAPQKPSPSATPAKSTKDANNRRVIESKKAPPKKETVAPKHVPSVEAKPKPERKPISRRPKSAKAPPSPMKKMTNGIQKPDSISKRGKLDKEGTTDSSTVSTPSADQESMLKKDISKLTPEEIQQLKDKELDELKEEQEAVKEIEAVFRKGEGHVEEAEPGVRKIKEISIDDNLEAEEYLIIEKEEIEHDSLDQETKEDEMQKLARDSEESEKQRKHSSEEKEIDIQKEETKEVPSQEIPKEEIPAKTVEDTESKKPQISSPEDKATPTTDKKELADEEVKEVVESHPEEKVSANVESGATTTAPTLPEDERITLDDIKEDNGQPIEEKHVKEETKEKEVPVIQLPPQSQQDTQPKIPLNVGISLDKQKHVRDIVKTPDEVADLPVHEEADYHEFHGDVKKTNESDNGKEAVKEDKKIEEQKEVKEVSKGVKEDESEKENDEKEDINEIKVDDKVQKEVRKEVTSEVKDQKEGDLKQITEKKDEPEKQVLKKDITEKLLTAQESQAFPDKEKSTPDVTKEEPVTADKSEVPDVEKSAEVPTSIPKEIVTKTDEAQKFEILEKAELETKGEVEKGAEEKLQEVMDDEWVVITKEDEADQDIVETAQEADKAIKETADDLKETPKDDKIIVEAVTEEKADEHKPDLKDEVEADKDIKKDEKLEKEGKAITEKNTVEQISAEEIATTKEETSKDLTVTTKLPKEEEASKEKEMESESEYDDHEIRKEDEIEEILEKDKEDIKALIEEADKKSLDDQKIGDTKESSDDSKGVTKTPEEEKINHIKETKQEVEVINNKIQELKKEVIESVEELNLGLPKRDLTKIEEPLDTDLKQDVEKLTELDDKLQELKQSVEEKTEKVEIKEEKEVKIEKSTKHPEHAEQVILPDSSPEEDDQPAFGELEIDKTELGRKSPAEREEDVKKIVVSVAVVLKSEAPLEQFQGKLPFTQELRETHITTQDSPILDSKVIIKDDIPSIPEEPAVLKEEPIPEESEIVEEEPSEIIDRRKDLIAGAQELMAASSKVISDIKSKAEEKIDKMEEKVDKGKKTEDKLKEKVEDEKERDDKEEEEVFKADDGDDKDEKDDGSGTVHRMLVTASSEDGGEEFEICPAGTITFSKSSESSERSSPEPSQKTQSQKSSIVETLSDTVSTVKQITEKDFDTKKNDEDKPEEGEKSVKEHTILDSVKDTFDSAKEFVKEKIEDLTKAAETKAPETDDIVSDIAKTVKTIAKDIKEKAKEEIKKIEEDVNEVKEKVTDKVEEAQKDLKDEIAGAKKLETGKIADKVDEKTSKALDVISSKAQEVSEKSNDVSDTIDNAKKEGIKVTEEFTDPKKEIGEDLNKVSSDLKDLKVEAEGLKDKIRDAKIAKDLTDVKKEVSDVLEQTLADTKEGVANKIKEKILDAEKIVTSKVEDVALMSKEVSKQLKEKVTKTKDEAEDKIKEIGEVAVDKSKEILSDVSDVTVGTKKSIKEEIGDVSKLSEEFKYIAKEETQTLKESVEKDVTDSKEVPAKSKDIIGKGEKLVKKLEQDLPQDIDEAKHKVEEVTGKDDEHDLSQARDEAKHSMEKAKKDIVAISSDFNDQANFMPVEVKEIIEKTESVASQFAMEFEKAADKVEQAVVDVKDAVAAKVEELTSATQTIVDEGKEFDKKVEAIIEKKVDDVKGDISSATVTVIEASTTSDKAKEKVAHIGHELEEKIQDEEKLSKIKHVGDEQTQEVKEKPEEDTDKIKEVKESLEKAEDAVFETKKDVFDKISDISTSELDFVDKLGETIGKKIDNVEKKAEKLVEKLADSKEKVADKESTTDIPEEKKIEEQIDDAIIKAKETLEEKVNESEAITACKTDDTAGIAIETFTVKEGSEKKVESLVSDESPVLRNEDDTKTPEHGLTKIERKESIPERKDSIVEKDEEILEKPEKLIDSVFSAIGDAAKSVLHEILPDSTSAASKVKSDIDESKDATEEAKAKEHVKLEASLSGKSTPDGLAKGEDLDSTPAVSEKPGSTIAIEKSTSEIDSKSDKSQDDLKSATQYLTEKLSTDQHSKLPTVIDASKSIQSKTEASVEGTHKKIEELDTKSVDSKEKVADGVQEKLVEKSIKEEIHDLPCKAEVLGTVEEKVTNEVTDNLVDEKSIIVEKIQDVTEKADTADVAKKGLESVTEKKDSSKAAAGQTEAEVKELTPERRESVIDRAEELLEQSEKAIGSVFSAIGDAAKTVLHEIFPEQESFVAKVKTDEVHTEKDKEIEVMEHGKLDSTPLSGKSSPDVLGKDARLETSPVVSGKSTPDIPKEKVVKETEKLKVLQDVKMVTSDVLEKDLLKKDTGEKKEDSTSVLEHSLPKKDTAVEGEDDSKPFSDTILKLKGHDAKEGDIIVDDKYAANQRHESVLETAETLTKKSEKAVESIGAAVESISHAVLSEGKDKDSEEQKPKDLKDTVTLKKEELQREEKESEDDVVQASDKSTTVADLTKTKPPELLASPEGKTDKELIEKTEKKTGDQIEHSVDKENAEMDKNKEREEKQTKEKDHSTPTRRESSDKTSGEPKIEKEIIEKEEKLIEKQLLHLQKSLDEVTDLTASISFDKCDISKQEDQSELTEIETLGKTLEKVSDITKSIVVEKEENLSDKVKMEPKETTSRSDIVIDSNKLEDMHRPTDEQCKKEKLVPEQQEKKDPEKEPDRIEESVEDKLEEIKQDKIESPSKKEKKVEQQLEHLKDSLECDITKSVHIEKTDSSLDSHKVDDKISECSKREKFEDILKKDISPKAKESVVLEDQHISSQTEKCEKESMEKTLSEKDSSSLKVEFADRKKLSISDVEICIKTEECPKDASQSFLDNERALLRDNIDAKMYAHPITSEDDDKASKSQTGSSSVLQVAEEIAGLSDKSSPDLELSGKTTPPTVPVSPTTTKDIKSPSSKLDSGLSEQTETDDEDLSTKSQIAHSQSDLDELDMKMDPMSMSFYGALPEEQADLGGEVPATLLYEITKARYAAELKQMEEDSKIKKEEVDARYKAELKQMEEDSKIKKEEVDLMTAGCIGELPSAPPDSKPSDPNADDSKKDSVDSWGKPLGLPAPTHLYEVTKAKFSSGSEETDLMTCSFIGDTLPTSSSTDRNQERSDPMTTSVYFEHSSDSGYDPIASWGKPLGLPSPAPPNNNEKGTPKKERKLPAYVTAKNKLNDDKKRAESPSKLRTKKINPVYVDLTYVPHHGNHYYSYVDFFKKIRARYYVFSGLEPSRQVYDALLEAKQTWEDKELEVTIIPTYDTDILGYWVAENEELLSKFKIDLSPSASRCTINLQDHETSCSAYRLEF